MTLARETIAFLACILMIGCGSSEGYKLASVSGKVQVDGKPVEGLRISFEPIGGADRPYPGPDSIGITDKDGRFTLATFNESQKKGAVVGKARVRIWSLPASQTAGANGKDISDDRAADYDPVAEIKAIKSQIRKTAKAKAVQQSIVIPLRFNDETTLTFDVPEKGSDTANFEIQSK